MPKLLVSAAGPVIPVVKPEWREQTLIFRHTSGRVEAVDAMAYGCLAVHGALPGETGAPVVVTHAPTKLAIVRVNEVEDAVAISERLWETCKPAFVTPDKDVDRSKIPPDVVEWIKQCNQQRKLTDHRRAFGELE